MNNRVLNSPLVNALMLLRLDRITMSISWVQVASINSLNGYKRMLIPARKLGQKNGLLRASNGLLKLCVWG